MNERIKELIEQATESTGFLTAGDSVKPLPVREFNKEKFAELIVRECADVGSKFSQAHPEDIRYQIKRHFGVEEPKGYQPTGWVCPKCGTDRTKAACPRGRGAATDGSCPMFGVAQ